MFVHPHSLSLSLPNIYFFIGEIFLLVAIIRFLSYNKSEVSSITCVHEITLPFSYHCCIFYLDTNSSYMSLVFLTNSTKMGLRFNASTIPSISLNNTNIDTLISIYPPTQNMSRKPVSYNSSDISAQTFYHLLDFTKHQSFEREIKRLDTSPRKRKLITTQQRFNFAKLADEVIKNKEDISSLSSPAAITSGVSLLTSKYDDRSMYFQYKCSVIFSNQSTINSNLSNKNINKR